MRYTLLYFVYANIYSLAMAQYHPHQNPYAPNSPWSEGHGVYCQQYTELPSFTAGHQFKVEVIPFEQGKAGIEPSGTMVSEPYGNGVYVTWGTNGKYIYKVINAPNKTSLVYADKDKMGYGLVSGYWTTTKNNSYYFVTMFDWKLYILADKQTDNPYSEIDLKKMVDLTSLKSQSSSFDFVLGVKLLYNGDIAITTRKGTIVIFDPVKEEIVATYKLENEIQNNMAAEEGGYFYVNTLKSTVKMLWDKKKLQQIWAVSTLQSGSTPTLMDVDGERFVVITAQETTPMKATLIWREDIPNDWQGIKGLPLRVAAVEDIYYDPEKKIQSEPTQNSVLVYQNNILFANWTGLWPRIGTGNKGLAVYTWDSSKRILVPKWQNPNISIPNSMQALSSSSNTLYAVGRTDNARSKTWVFYGINWDNGTIRFQYVLGENRIYNITGSGIQIGYNGDIITMSPNAVIRISKK